MVYSYVYMTFSLLFNVELQAFSIFPTSSSTAFWACKTVLLCLASWRHRSQIPATFTWRVQTSLQIFLNFTTLYGALSNILKNFHCSNKTHKAAPWMRPRRSPSAHLRSCSWIPSWRRSRRARSWWVTGRWAQSSFYWQSLPDKSTSYWPFLTFSHRVCFCFVPLIPRTPWPRWSSASKPAAWNPESWLKSVDSSESVP